MEIKIFNKDKLKEDSIKDKIVRVKALIVNSRNEILLGKAFGTIQYPGGHLEDGENLNEGLKREIKEETGIKLDGIYEPFFVIKHLIKDPVGNNNRALEIYYFKVFTDQLFNLDNTSLDDQEKAGGFNLFYLPLKDLKKVLKKSIKDNPLNKLIVKEMLLAKKKWDNTNGIRK